MKWINWRVNNPTVNYFFGNIVLSSEEYTVLRKNQTLFLPLLFRTNKLPNLKDNNCIKSHQIKIS